MKEKTKKIILYSSLATIVVFIVVAIIKKKKDDANLNKNSGGGGGGGSNLDPCGGRSKDTSDYGNKVMSLQKKVGIDGCDVDGIVGSQTNNAVKLKYPTLYLQLGGVSESNIDKYLSAGTSKTELSYEDKVKQLQKLLGMPSNLQTGFAGDITNGNVQRKYPNEYARYGKIGANNIDTYISIVKSRIPTFG